MDKYLDAITEYTQDMNGDRFIKGIYIMNVVDELNAQGYINNKDKEDWIKIISRIYDVAKNG